MRDGVDGADRVLIDPAPLSADGTTAIDWWTPSHDGARVAWGLSEAGSEESTLRVRDVATRRGPARRASRTRVTRRWPGCPTARRSSTRATPRRATCPPGDEKYFCRVFRHALGRRLDERPARLRRGPRQARRAGGARCRRAGGGSSCACTWAGRRARSGCATWRRRDAPLACRWRAGVEALYEPIPLDDVLYVHDQRGRAALPPLRGRLRRSRSARAGGRCSPERRATCSTDVAVVGGDRRVARRVVPPRGERPHRALRGATGRRSAPSSCPCSAPRRSRARGTRTRCSSSSRRSRRPGGCCASTWRTARTTTSGTAWARASPLPDVRVSMLYATSKDGTRVPMFVVEKAGHARATAIGPRSSTATAASTSRRRRPSARARCMTVEHGGVWAVALLRGGGEFGEEWHRAGMLERKQNVFDDLYACAEKLVRAQVTRPEQARRRRRLERGAARRRRRHAASGAVPRSAEPRAPRRHAPLPPLPHRRASGPPSTATRTMPPPSRWLHAYSPYHQAQGRPALPVGALHDRRERLAGRPDARAQDGGAPAGSAGRRDAAHPAAGREPGGPRGREARGEAGRRAGRRAGFPLPRARDEVRRFLDALFSARARVPS